MLQLVSYLFEYTRIHLDTSRILSKPSYLDTTVFEINISVNLDIQEVMLMHDGLRDDTRTLAKSFEELGKALPRGTLRDSTQTMMKLLIQIEDGLTGHNVLTGKNNTIYE